MNKSMTHILADVGWAQYILAISTDLNPSLLLVMPNKTWYPHNSRSKFDYKIQCCISSILYVFKSIRLTYLLGKNSKDRKREREREIERQIHERNYVMRKWNNIKIKASRERYRRKCEKRYRMSEICI